MGSRASYTIIEGGEKTSFYNHWGAQCIPEDFFWGSESSLSFIRANEESDYRLSDSWCEGAVVIDCDNRVFSLFGGQCILWSNSLKRVFLALLKINWQGWHVKWAEHEVFSIAKAMGEDPFALADTNIKLIGNISACDIKDSMQSDSSLVSIKKKGMVRHFEMDYNSDDILFQGDLILSTFSVGEGISLTQKASGYGYDNYLFLDQDSLTIFYDNEFSREYGLHEKLASIWPTWEVVEHNKGMYQHATLCGREWLEFVCDKNELLSYIGDILLKKSMYDPQDTITALVNQGHDVEVVDPLVMQTNSPNITSDTKEKIYKKICEQWLSEEDHFEAALRCDIW